MAWVEHVSALDLYCLVLLWIVVWLVLVTNCPTFKFALLFPKHSGLLLAAAALAVTANTEYDSAAARRTIQLARASLKESPCTPDAALSQELVHVSCELSGQKALGGNIVGVQDVPEAQRVGLRLESKCEVQQWEARSEKSSNEDEVAYDRKWTSKFLPRIDYPSDCMWQNGGRSYPYHFPGYPCVNTDPEDQPWWTADMHINRSPRFGESSWYVVESQVSNGQPVLAGGFRVPADLLDKLGNSAPQMLQPALDCSKGASHCPVGALIERFEEDWFSQISYVTYQDLIGPTWSPTPMRRKFRLATGRHRISNSQEPKEPVYSECTRPPPPPQPPLPPPPPPPPPPVSLARQRSCAAGLFGLEWLHFCAVDEPA